MIEKRMILTVTLKVFEGDDIQECSFQPFHSTPQEVNDAIRKCIVDLQMRTSHENNQHQN